MKTRIGKLLVSVLALIMSSAVLIGFAGAANATTPVNGYGSGGIMVTVYTGSKNTGNHTQYVSTIYITDFQAGYCYAGDPVEAWAGNVWYGSTNGCSTGYSFYINRWVPSGSGVCGSFYRYYDFGHTFPGQQDNIKRLRAVACITISV